MDRIAIISDVHGNLTALNAVLIPTLKIVLFLKRNKLGVCKCP